MNTNKRIRFNSPIVTYRDSNDNAPLEMHNTRLESYDIIKSIDRGSTEESRLLGKPIIECDDDLISNYDGGDFYNGILYSSIRGNCGIVVATPCSFDGDPEYCPPQITHIATIGFSNASDRTFPDGLAAADSNHGIGRGRYVSYIFVPVNHRGEYGLAQYYYFINPEVIDNSGIGPLLDVETYPKYVAPTFSIGVSDDVDYVEAYRTVERDVKTGLPVNNNYYLFGNFYKSLNQNLLRNVGLQSGFITNANSSHYNCFLYDVNSNFIDIKSLLNNVQYDFRIDQDWRWNNGQHWTENKETPPTYPQLNYMWVRGYCQLAENKIELPLPVGTEFRFNNLPSGSILDETKIYTITGEGEFRPDSAGDEACNCWAYYFEFDAPETFDYIADVLAGDNGDAYRGYLKLATMADPEVVITMTEDERDAVLARETNPSSIVLFPSEDETLDDTGYYIKVVDYHRWNTNLTTLISERIQAPITGEEWSWALANADEAFERDSDGKVINPRTGEQLTFQDPEWSNWINQSREQNIANEAGVSGSVIGDDNHLPPPSALVFSEIKKSLAFGLKKEICIKQS